MAVLEPRLSILDETDSGLDIDALRAVAHGVNTLQRPDSACVVITHYQRLLDYIKPQFVHILYKGRIVTSGGPELALRLEDEDVYKRQLQRRVLASIARCDGYTASESQKLCLYPCLLYTSQVTEEATACGRTNHSPQSKEQSSERLGGHRGV